jgi:hypothetical protein
VLLGIAQSNYVFEALSASLIALASGFDGFSLLPLGLEGVSVTFERGALVLVAGAFGVDLPSVLDGLLQNLGAVGAAFCARWGATPNGRQNLECPKRRGAREDRAEDSNANTPAREPGSLSRGADATGRCGHPTRLVPATRLPVKPLVDLGSSLLHTGFTRI